MSDRTEAEIRNAALEEAAAVVGTVRVLNTQFASGYLMPRPESRSAAAAISEAIEAIRALKSAPAADACRTDVRQAQPKRRPYNATASLSEYGIFPECDAAQAPAKGAGDDWRLDHSAGRPILVYQNCSVIEAEQAEYVLRLIEADRQQRGGDVLAALQGLEIARTALIDISDLSDAGADERSTIVNVALTRINQLRSRAALAATKGENNE